MGAEGQDRRIGDRLRSLLDERFVTQAELAQALGVDLRNVSRWVQNQTCPQKRRLRQIAEYFEVPPASLLNDHDERVVA